MLSAVLAWETFKDRVSARVHPTHWDLHVILGLVLFLLFARLLRRPPTSLVPLVPVALLELGNETLDFLRAWPRWCWNWPDTLIEIALTLAPPLASRCWRRACRGCAASPRPPVSASCSRRAASTS